MTDSSIYLYSISNNFIQRFNIYNIYQYRYYYIIVRGDTFGTKVYNIDEKTTFMICARSMYIVYVSTLCMYVFPISFP
jgi:hypothetical protein